jgi:FkbM family methyltransferase
MAKVKEDNHQEDSLILLSHIDKSLQKKGVIHIGAHLGEEVELYFEKGFEKVVLIEANPETFSILNKKFEENPKVLCFNCAIGENTEKVKFNIYRSRTDNTESSSILPFDQFDNIVETLKLKKQVDMMCYSLPDFMKKYALEFSDFELLVLDIQGADYYALLGANMYLDRFSYIITELNYIPLYKNSDKDQEIKDLLNEKGFKLADEIVHTLYDDSGTFPAWGEAIFIKEK